MLSVKRAAAPGPGRTNLARFDPHGATVLGPGGTEERVLSGIDPRPC
jgi:hypothetical protein